MVTFLARKYAHLLTKEDIMALFDLLKKKTGSQSEAAKLCGLTRKTTYDWKEIGELKGETKEKVLSVLIDNLPRETLSLIADRASKFARDSVVTYLSVLHSLALQSPSVPEFTENAKLFDEARTAYGGLVAGMYETEMGKMLSDLNAYARSLGADWHPVPVRIFSETHLSELLPIVMAKLRTGSPDFAGISRELQISPELASKLREGMPSAPLLEQGDIAAYTLVRAFSESIRRLSETTDIFYMVNSPASSLSLKQAVNIMDLEQGRQETVHGPRWIKILDPAVAGPPLNPAIEEVAQQ
jgi:hypothetical protein